jgi:orotate phosphoribosyltransferase
MQLFKDAGAILEGHFLLTSGLHSPIYWEKFRILQDPHFTEKLCSLIADHFKEDKVQLVAGPTTGGIIIAYEVARQLGVKGVFAEKEGAARVFRRGFSINPHDRILIVDDILTTGSSITEVIEAVNKLGATIVGIGVLVDRAEQKIEFGVPLFSCLRSATVTYSPANCPLCAAGTPMTRPGGQT